MIALSKQLENHWKWMAWKPDGHGGYELAWEEEADNLITRQGAGDSLDKHLKGSTYTAAWFLGLVDNASFTAFATADTHASHAGWIETHTTYSESTRPAVVWGAVSTATDTTETVSSAVRFTMTSTITLRGGFVSNQSIKGSTSANILYGEVAFGSTQLVQSGYLVDVTITATALAA
jgi:hypothetical protein